MRKLKHLFMFCLFGMVSIVASAADIPNNEIWYTSNDGEVITLHSSNVFGVSIVSNTYTNGKGIIKFDGNVTSIGESAFIGCSGLTSVTIPNSVTKIDDDAFYGCYELTSIEIPNSVTLIIGTPFECCHGLTTITVESGNTVYDSRDNCNAIIETKSNTLIRGCRNTIIPNSVTSIGEEAFQDCSGLTSIIIPNSVTEIGELAFANCSDLYNIYISNSVTSIGLNAFAGCTSLPVFDNIRYADTYLIGVENTTLSTYEIQEGTKWIGNNAFSYCYNLTSIEIPNSVIYIDSSAFSGCSSLKSVNITDLDKWAEIEFNSYDANPLYYADKLYLNGQLVTEAKLNSARKIGEGAFANYSQLTSIEIPNSVTSIGHGAFEYCSGLASVTIPSSVTSIGGMAFEYCSGLTSVTIGYFVKTIEDYAFSNCSNLTSVTIPNSVTKIGQEAFARCKSLKSIEIPTSVVLIDGLAFWECTSLESVYVGWKDADKIPSIHSDEFPFSNCDLYVPFRTSELYKAKDFWKTFKNIIEPAPNIIIINTDDTNSNMLADEGDEVELNDNIKSISIAEGIGNVNISYTRNFANADKWQGWYMPFDVAYDDMTAAGLDVAQIHGVLLDKDRNTVLAFLKLDEGTIKANTPYVVRPKVSGDVTLETTTDLQPTETTNFMMMSATDTYHIGGVYEQTVGNEWYAINKQGQFQKMGDGVYLRPFRIWMTIDPRSDNPYAQSAGVNAKMDIVVIGDDETTGIQEASPKSSPEGKDLIHNLNGQRVTSIQSGRIYIMNGKKYIAR